RKFRSTEVGLQIAPTRSPFSRAKPSATQTSSPVLTLVTALAPVSPMAKTISKAPVPGLPGSDGRTAPRRLRAPAERPGPAPERPESRAGRGPRTPAPRDPPEAAPPR